MTRFLPGEISAAFQNSVPKSIPITWVETTPIRRTRATAAMNFMILIYLYHTSDIPLIGV